MKWLFSIAVFWAAASAWADSAPTPIAIIGLAHEQAGAFINELRSRPDASLVGIVESNRDLIVEYRQRYGLGAETLFSSFDEMIRKVHPRAAAVFSQTVQHRAIVEKCAQYGMDVMLEKPLAINLEEARALAAAAKKAGIRVIVDYETAWFPASESAYEIARTKRSIGAIRKIVVRAGHRGPKEIGCSPQFLSWLTDPAQSGGGALIDFGCYGADEIAWLMDGERPVSVTAATQHLKPQIYGQVDDEATVIVEYPHTHAIIEASWNWPYEVRELQVYGGDGYLLVTRPDEVRVRKGGSPETQVRLVPPPRGQGITDDLSCLLAVARHEVQPAGMASLDLNLTVTEILDAARESARTGRRIDFAPASTGQ
ncbi:MAG TPA: Gfo/Idh/MocA family oxidoreductase [Verrucomicrobiae bacterium]|jgi:predicted dehydrogenase